MAGDGKSVPERIEKIEQRVEKIESDGVAAKVQIAALDAKFDAKLPLIERLLWVTMATSTASAIAVASDRLGGPSAGEAVTAVARFLT